MSIIKNIFQFTFVFFLMSCSVTPPATYAQGGHNHSHDHNHSHEPPALALNMEQDRDENFTLFKLTNNAEEVFRTSPVASNYNRLVFITKDGKKREYHSWKRVVPTEIKPGETHTWRVDTRLILEDIKLENEVDIQMIWNVNGVKSAPFILNQRN